MNNSKSKKDIKTENKTWLSVYIAVGLVLVVGLVLFLSPEKKDPDSFPELTLESGITLKGQFVNEASGFYEYEADDSCVHPTSLDAQTLSAGQNYYYATEDLTIQQIKERINCVPYNKIRIMYLEPTSQKFYSWPKAVHNETEALTDPSTVTVKANTTFIIQSKDETFMGEIYNVDTPSPYLPFSPAVNVFDPSGYYGYVNDIPSGWVSLAGIENGAAMTADLNNSALASRVEKLFYKNGPDINAFEETVISGPPIADIDFSAGEYMIWMRLGEAQALIEPPQVCQGEDPSHACITDSDPSGDGNVLVDRNSGDLACSNVLNQSCLSIEKNCDVKNSENNGWQVDNNTSCSSAFLLEPISCWYRAVCGEEPVVEESTDGPCGGAGESHVCLTDDGSGYQAMVPDSNSLARGEIIYQSGENACQNELNLSCVDIEAYCGFLPPELPFTATNYSEDWDEDFVLSLNNQEVFDTNDHTCTSTFNGGSQFVPACLWRAVCGDFNYTDQDNPDYCGGADDSHVCLTFEDVPLPNPIIPRLSDGDTACQNVLSNSCTSIEKSETGGS